MGEPWRHAQWSKSVTEGYMLYDSTYTRYLEIVNLMEIENGMVVSSIWGWEEIGNHCTMGTKFHMNEL